MPIGFRIVAVFIDGLLQQIFVNVHGHFYAILSMASCLSGLIFLRNPHFLILQDPAAKLCPCPNPH